MITLTSGTVVETVSVKLPDGSLADEFELPSGRARVRVLPVPPMLISDTMSSRVDLDDPTIPKVKIEGIGEKWAPVRPGQEAYDEWEKECLAQERRRNAAHSDTTWSYGMAEWNFGEAWEDEPPKGWKFPARIKRLGHKPRSGDSGKRLDFILYTLLASNDDTEACQMVMYSMTNPLRNAEVDAIASLFRGEEGREDSSPASTE